MQCELLEAQLGLLVTMVHSVLKTLTVTSF